MKLKVTYKPTGRIWIEENKPHAWSSLCLHIMKRHSDFNLIYCDIEGLALKYGNPDFSQTWLMYDECGGCEEIPKEYLVEVIENGKA